MAETLKSIPHGSSAYVVRSYEHARGQLLAEAQARDPGGYCVVLSRTEYDQLTERLDTLSEEKSRLQRQRDAAFWFLMNVFLKGRAFFDGGRAMRVISAGPDNTHPTLVMPSSLAATAPPERIGDQLYSLVERAYAARKP